MPHYLPKRMFRSNVECFEVMQEIILPHTILRENIHKLQTKTETMKVIVKRFHQTAIKFDQVNLIAMKNYINLRDKTFSLYCRRFSVEGRGSARSAKFV